MDTEKERKIEREYQMEKQPTTKKTGRTNEPVEISRNTVLLR
jgi:hypothetical protein